MPMLPARPLRRVALGASLAFSALAACGDGGSSHSTTDASTPADASGNRDDAATAPEGDGSVSEGTPDGGVVATDAGADAGCEATNSCAALDPLAPFALNCQNLPSNGVCAGGPREVLLAMESAGWIGMFDPADGHFLGYFKRPTADYNLLGRSDYWYATQGPDQCIWTVSEDDNLQIERWNTDGSYRDKPLKQHYIPLTGGQQQATIDTPRGLAFTKDFVYVGSTSGSPNEPVLSRYTLADGKFESVVLDDGTVASSMEVLGDGSLLISDQTSHALVRVTAGKPPFVEKTVNVPAQVKYVGDGKVLLADGDLGEPVHEVDLDTQQVSTVYPFMSSSSNKYGMAKLGNGQWLMSGGEFYVSSLDPASMDPVGQYKQVFDDPAADSVTFRYIGRACLPNSVVEARMPKPPQNTCTDVVPAGAAILEENFEGSADFTGTGAARAYKSFADLGGSGVTVSLETPAGAGATRSLKILGGSNALRTGVRVSFSSPIKPKYVSFRVKTGVEPDSDVARELTLGLFGLANEAVMTDNYQTTRVLTSYTYNDYFRAGDSSVASADQVRGKWLHVEMRNIDWNARTYDMYVDCTRLGEGVSLPAGQGDDVDVLDIYNYVGASSANAVAWFDDILIK